MTHQLFGEHESIFGYKDLEVQVYHTAGRLIPYLHINFSDKVSSNDGLIADNVSKILRADMGPDVLTSLDDFLKEVEKDGSFQPFGQLLHSYNILKDGEEREFQIYKTDIEHPGFREYHQRLQFFILFFVDAASFIDDADDKWTFYLLFEKYKCDNKTKYATAGYMTAYRYYAYPENTRPRISQFLIMPPFQRQGHGAQLLQTFYNDVVPDLTVVDITVEDPSENFQHLRDFVDARNCASLKNFQPDYLLEGFHSAMAEEAQKHLRLTKRQARRVYEILRLRVTDESNKSMFRQYRLDVKKRLNTPFQKSKHDFIKLEKALRPEELAQTLSCTTPEQRHAQLEKQFQEHVTEYRHILERLAASAKSS